MTKGPAPAVPFCRRAAALSFPPAAAGLDDLEHVLGQAWEASGGAGVRRVRALVGLSASEPLARALADRDREQRAEIAALRARLDDLERRVAEAQP